MEAHDLTVNHIRMRWLESGQGDPLVLVHGIPTGPRLWRHVVPKIDGARCLAWEMVGYGESIPEGRGTDISVDRQADYLLAWLDEMGIKRAVLAGHDLGGGVVQIAAVRRPEICAGLFLTNAIGYDSWPILGVRAMRALGDVVQRLPNAVFKQVFGAFLRQGHSDSSMARESIDVHWDAYARHDGAAAFIRQARSLDVRDTLAVAQQLPGLNVPARIAWGAADRFQTIEYGERFSHSLNAPLHRIEQGKHFTPEDHPQVIAAEINELIKAVHGPSEGP
ncbi:MAG: alpha/beta fold hydrolase [Halofilum sp. (in: g-proteobacteria)]